MDGARALELVTRVRERADHLGLKLSIAVVDGGGYLLAFTRMDGAPPFTVEVSQGKAYGVIFLARPSAAIKEMADTRPQFFDAVKSLGMRTAIPSPGGLPLPGGGAIGVSGAADPLQDVDVAEYGIRAVFDGGIEPA